MHYALKRNDTVVKTWSGLPRRIDLPPPHQVVIFSPSPGELPHGYTLEEYTPPPPPPPSVDQLKALVDEEWTRRVFGEFVFQGETYHADRDSVDNIIGAASMARSAMSEGVQAGNLYWHCPDPSSPPENAVPFAWKSKSNSLIPMDAPTVEALAKALFAHKHSHFLAARALKEMDPIPADYTSDTYWP